VEWTTPEETLAVGEIWIQLRGWTTQRRFVVLRERVREGKSAVGRVLLDMPGYNYRIFVTNRSESAEIILRDYNARTCIEQRVEELKNDLSAGGFCVREFFGTESAFPRCSSPSTCSASTNARSIRVNLIASRPPCARRCLSPSPSSA